MLVDYREFFNVLIFHLCSTIDYSEQNSWISKKMKNELYICIYINIYIISYDELFF